MGKDDQNDTQRKRGFTTSVIAEILAELVLERLLGGSDGVGDFLIDLKRHVAPGRPDRNMALLLKLGYSGFMAEALL